MGRVVFAAVVGVACIGCADSDQLPTYPVSGKIVFPDGMPLSGGGVICLSESESEVVSLCARGVIHSDGTFTLGTYSQEDGAIEGRHLVAIDPPLPENFNPDAGPPPSVIHARFQQHDTSGLEFKVTPGELNEITLEVSRQ